MWISAVVSYLLWLCLDWITLRALAVGLGVMCVGLLLPCLRGPTKYGDFSYGTYVYHSPVVQAFISRGIVTAAPLAALGLIGLTTAFMAMASWHFIEKPWLKATLRGAPHLTSRLPDCLDLPDGLRLKKL